MKIRGSLRSMGYATELVAALCVYPVNAQTVKVTPLGSHTGELCQNDRALLFEDPTGVRILYDVGTAVAGAADPRLGNIDVVLFSHAHPDHIADRKAVGLNAGICAQPETVPATPLSNSVEIAAAKECCSRRWPQPFLFLGSKTSSAPRHADSCLRCRQPRQGDDGSRRTAVRQPAATWRQENDQARRSSGRGPDFISSC